MIRRLLASLRLCFDIHNYTYRRVHVVDVSLALILAHAPMLYKCQRLEQPDIYKQQENEGEEPEPDSPTYTCPLSHP